MIALLLGAVLPRPFSYKAPQQICGGYVDAPGVAYSVFNRNFAVSLGSCSLTAIVLTVYYRQFSVFLTKNSASWALSASSIATSGFTLSWANSASNGMQIGSFGYLAYDPTLLREMNFGTIATSTNYLYNNGLYISYSRSESLAVTFGMYSSGTILGKVANKGCSFFTRVDAARYYQPDAYVPPSIPPTQDENYYGYYLTATRGTYGVIYVTVTVGPYTCIYSYQATVIGWTEFLSLDRTIQYHHGTWSYSASASPITGGPDISMSYSTSKTFTPTLSSFPLTINVLSGVTGFLVDQGYQQAIVLLPWQQFSGGSFTQNVLISQVSNIIYTAGVYAFFVKKYCPISTDVLDGDRQSCRTSCNGPLTTDFVSGYCGGYNNMSQTDGTTPCSIKCFTCGEPQYLPGTVVCFYCNPLNQRYWDPQSGGSCLCYPGFFDVGAANCSMCNIICGTCSGPSSFSCTSCNGNFRYLSGGTCLCKSGWYDGGAVGCLPCHFSCASCYGPEYNQCTWCNLGATYRFLSGGQCLCSFRFFSALGVSACQPCYYACYTCLNAFQCSGCSSSLDQRYQSGSQCLCNAGFYDNTISTLCLDCTGSPVFCKTCTSSTKCLTCESAYNRFLSHGYCTCLPNYYQVGTNQACSPCHYTCLTCSGGGSWQCLSCDALDNRQLSGGSCPCSSLTVINGALCSFCFYRCYTCSTAASNGCTNCGLDTGRYYSGGSCPCQTVGYYDSGKLQCSNCSAFCYSCSGPASNQCTACDSSTAKRYQTGSNCPCQPGYYSVDQQQVCPACNYYCSTCTYLDHCSSCPATRSIVTITPANPTSKVTCLCNAQYSESGLATCTLCHYTCLTCVDNNILGCLSCEPASNRYFEQRTGKCECAPAFYQLSVPALCQPCTTSAPNYCAKCQLSPGYCTLCINPNFIAVAGICSCPTGFYASGLLCQACANSCLTCSGSSTSCTACSYFQFRDQLSGFSCFCSPGFFQTGAAVCSKCIQSCISCTTASNCFSCAAPSVLPTCSCPIGNFVTTFNVCSSCTYWCLSCVTIDYCTACPSTRKITSNGQCPCIGNYIDKMNNLCDPLICPTNCLSCTPYSCITCMANFILYLNGCMCPEGKLVSAGTCLSCSNNCRTCKGKVTTCTSCNFALQSISLAQVCTCVPSTYDLGDKGCGQCFTNCRSCLSQATCLSCVPNYLLTDNNCLLICDEDRFYRQSSMSCEPKCERGQAFKAGSCVQSSILDDSAQPFTFKIAAANNYTTFSSSVILTFSKKARLKVPLAQAFKLFVDRTEVKFNVSQVNGSYHLLFQLADPVAFPLITVLSTDRSLVAVENSSRWFLQNPSSNCNLTQLVGKSHFQLYNTVSSLSQAFSFVPLLFTYIVLSRSFLIVQNYQLAVIALRFGSPFVPFTARSIEFLPYQLLRLPRLAASEILLVSQVVFLAAALLVSQYTGVHLLAKRVRFYFFNTLFYVFYGNLLPILLQAFRLGSDWVPMGLLFSGALLLSFTALNYFGQLFGVFSGNVVDNWLVFARLVRNLIILPLISLQDSGTSLALLAGVQGLFAATLYFRTQLIFESYSEIAYTLGHLLIIAVLYLSSNGAYEFVKLNFFYIGLAITFWTFLLTLAPLAEVIFRLRTEYAEIKADFARQKHWGGISILTKEIFAELAVAPEDDNSTVNLVRREPAQCVFEQV